MKTAKVCNLCLDVQDNSSHTILTAAHTLLCQRLGHCGLSITAATEEEAQRTKFLQFHKQGLLVLERFFFFF